MSDDLVKRLDLACVGACDCENDARNKAIKDHHPICLWRVITEAKARIEALTAENAKLREAAEWRPIETAPRDGTEFQGWIVSADGRGFWEPRCRINEHGAQEIWGRVDYDQDGWELCAPWKIINWLPQPEPPK